MTNLGLRKLHICPKVTKMGSIIVHRIDGSCLLWVMSTEISVDIAVDIAVDSGSIVR